MKVAINGLQNKSSQIRAICLLVFLCFYQSSPAAQPELTAEEQSWLKNHPVIRIGVDPHFKPFEWISKRGQHKGMAADYLRVIEKKLGIKFKVVQKDTWSEILLLAGQHKLDVLPAVAASRSRSEYLLFTDPYIEVPGILVSGLNHMGIDDLSKHKVAVVRDYYWDEKLTQANKEIIIKRVDDLKFGLELASLGAVDAMVTDLASATSYIQELGLNNLHIMNDASGKLGSLKLSMGVRNDWPVFYNILNKTLAKLSQSEVNQIRSKWITFIEPAFWRNQGFWYAMLAIFSIFLLSVISFIFWNRTLKRQVVNRTQELHHAQLRLMQAEKMESVGRLAAGIAHEVKNPLAIIQMGADYLATQTDDNLASESVIRDIRDAVKRANDVILGLLDFSRDKQIEMKPGKINQVIKSSLHLVEHEFRQRSIQVQLSLAENLPEIPIDENKLQQVFINLYMNSAQAINSIGDISISSQAIIYQAKNFNNFIDRDNFLAGEMLIQVEILDSGPGISEQDRAKIFDLFYTTKEVGEGTGLGLSVSRNIVKLHHGSIEIFNHPLGGAVVRLLFKTNKGTT